MSIAHVTFWQAGGFSLLYTRGSVGRRSFRLHRLKGTGQAAPDRPLCRLHRATAESCGSVGGGALDPVGSGSCGSTSSRSC